MIIYTVRPGDTLSSIASRYGISIDTIAYDNQIPYPYALVIGASLLLSQADSVLVPEDILVSDSSRSVYSGGYAYPFISPWVLEQTLPYLTDLFIFSYGFTLEGALVPPALDDTFMITLSKNYGVAPILTLTPFGPDGMFNNYLITTVVNNAAAKQRLIGELAGQITERGFEGVDIDFEYILAEDRVPFAEFVSEVRSAINALGYPVWSSL